MINYILAVILNAAEIVLFALYLIKSDILSSEKDTEVTKFSDRLNKKNKIIIICIIFTVCIALCSVSLVINVSNSANLVKLLILYGLIAFAAVIDTKKKIIPNFLIIIGISARVIIYIIEFFVYRETFVPVIKSDLIGFAVGFGILLVVALVTRGAMGFGDVKLFGVIGLMSGAICTYSTLILSLVASAVVSLILLISKKKNRKDTIPFAPFIFIGYFAAVLLSAY